jgi:hypothetical protein
MPHKTYTKNFDERYLEKRKLLLENFMIRVCSRECLRKSEQLKTFLKPELVPEHMRVVDKKLSGRSTPEEVSEMLVK